MNTSLDTCSVTFTGNMIKIYDHKTGKGVDLSNNDPAGKLIYNAVGKLKRQFAVNWVGVGRGTQVVVKRNLNLPWETAYFAAYLPKGIKKYAVFAAGDDFCKPQDSCRVVYVSQALLIDTSEEEDADA
jgi:hypothetical protein